MRNDVLAAMLGTAVVISTPAHAQSATAFTYQGHLVESGTPADGLYEFEVRLLDDLAAQIGTTETPIATVTEGVFQMDLDFGPAAFDGSQRFLEISVRSVMDGGAFTTLSPNHPVTSTPVAQFALEGNEGPVGPQGNQGSPGADGNDGAPGVDGAQGPQGVQGGPGNDGAQGPQGDEGDPGNDGAPGDSHWKLSGSNTYYNTGNVGFGVSNPQFPIHVETAGIRGLYSVSTSPIATTFGVHGRSDSNAGRGVYGESTAATGSAFGVHGRSLSIDGRGVYGEAMATSGTTSGVHGQSASTTGQGVYGKATATSGFNYGVYGQSESLSGKGVYGVASAATGFATGVYGLSNSTDARGVLGEASASTGETYGVYGYSRSSGGRGVYGRAVSTANTGITSYGVYGRADSPLGRGVYGFSSSFNGIGHGVYGEVLSPNAYAGYFVGGKNYFQGNVGIGTTGPVANLHINSTTGTDIFRVQRDGSTKMLINANGGISLGTFSSTVPDGDVLVSGNLTVGTFASSTTFGLNVSGTAGKTGGGSWAVFSDQRLKKNITSMTGSLDTVSALRPVNFEYNSEDHFFYTPGTQRGFIAQEVQKVIPKWVHTANDGYLYLDQTGYEALIVDALQELRAEKDAEINQLQARINRLERAVSMLLKEK